jgi:predicted CopG family antitoxin
MLQNMSMSQETKEALNTEIFSSTFPILRDRTVLILTILLTIFDQVHDEKIEQLKDNFSTLLQRYLEKKEQSMDPISICINNLHQACQIFKDLTRDRNPT